MLIATGETPAYTAGPLDVVLILHNANTGRYHMAFFEEHPMPGPVVPHDELDVVRLKSKMHHTEGAETFEDALGHMDQFLAESVEVPDGNIYRDAPIEWDGEIGIVCVVGNWRRSGAERQFNPTEMAMNLRSAVKAT